MRLDDRQRWMFLVRTSRALSGTLNLRRTSGLAARLTADGLADRCGVTLGPETGLAETAVAPYAGETGSARFYAADLPLGGGDGGRVDGGRADAGAVRRVLVTGLLEQHDDVSREQARSLCPAGLDPGDARTVLLVPLLARGSCFGVMTLTRSEPYDATELTLVRDHADRVASSLDTARLYEDEARTVETMRSVLLPAALPAIEGVRIGAAYRASARGALVGGDFYEVLPEAGGGWMIALGDVSGKGLEAALYSGRVRQTLYAAATTGDGPRRTLDLLNRTLLMSEVEGRFATLVVGRVVPRPDGSVRLWLADGGHLPPMIVRRSGRVEQVRLGGTIVGLLEEAWFGEATTTLLPGDALYLYTDGVVEARDPDGRMYEEERLTRDLAGYAGAPPGAVVEGIEQRALQHLRNREHDDIAILGLQAWPAGHGTGDPA